MITPALQKLSQQLGYTFKDAQLLKQALTHRSAQKIHNERLEFLGDAILGMIITTALFQRNPTASEGELSYMRAALVCEKTLAELGQAFQLKNYIRVGASELGQYRKRPALLADTLEALIGAIYLDGGWTPCETCVLSWYKELLDQVKYIAPSKDPKTTLQEYLQANGRELPRYSLMSQTGRSHEPIFTIACKLPDRIEFPLVKGIGKNRREAEQQAATKVLTLLQERDDTNYSSDGFKPLDDN